MRIHAAADVHLGNHRRHGGPLAAGLNERCRQGLDVLWKACAAARADGAAALVIAGDLFDSSHPEPQLLAAVQRTFRAHEPLQIVVLVGNHDQDSMTPGDHALGPLAEYCIVAESPRVCEFSDNDGAVELVCLPYNPAPAAEWLAPTLAALLPDMPTPGVRRLLAVHLGIADDETPPWLRGARDAVHVDVLTPLLAEHGIEAAFAGNWHNHAVWDDPGYPAIVQCGALVPTGWDNPGLDDLGGLAAYDTRTSKFDMRFLPGPRFVKVASAEAARAQAILAQRSGMQLYVEARVAPGDVPAVLGECLVLKASGAARGVEVLADMTESKAEARTAAHAARSQATLEESLVAYVEAMPLDDRVERRAVIDRVSRVYLKPTRDDA